MNAFAFFFTFYTMKGSIPSEFLGDITVVQFCNLKHFLKKTLKIFHSYNLDLALFPSGKKPHKPRHKHKGKSKRQFGLPFPHLSSRKIA